MDLERLRHKGRLAEDREKAARLKMKLEGLVESMRSHLDPFEAVDQLSLDLVAEQAIEARAAQIDYQAALEQIRAIEKALGR